MQELGEKACAAYLRSCFLQPNKAVFDVTALPVAEFGLSMGLSSVPQLRFLRQAARQKQAGSQSKTTVQANGHMPHASQTEPDPSDQDKPMQGGHCGSSTCSPHHPSHMLRCQIFLDFLSNCCSSCTLNLPGILQITSGCDLWERGLLWDRIDTGGLE